jgi:hypothetical protein
MIFGLKNLLTNNNLQLSLRRYHYRFCKKLAPNLMPLLKMIASDLDKESLTRLSIQMTRQDS